MARILLILAMTVSGCGHLTPQEKIRDPELSAQAKRQVCSQLANRGLLSSPKDQGLCSELELRAGELAMRDQNFETARYRFERALSFGGNPATAHNALGRVWMARGEYHRACQAFERALTVSPQHPEALRNRIRCLLADDQLEAAEIAIMSSLGD